MVKINDNKEGTATKANIGVGGRSRKPGWGGARGEVP